MGLVIIAENNFTYRDFVRLGAEYAQTKVNKLTCLDVTALVNREMFNASVISENIEIMTTEEEFFSFVRSNKDEVFLLYLGESKLFFRLLLEFERHDVKYILSRLGAQPEVKYNNSLYSKLRYIFNIGLIKYMLKIFYSYKVKKFLQTSRAHYLVAGVKPASSIRNKNKIIWSCSLDYNYYNAEYGSAGKDKIIFLDEFEPFHPDFERLKIKTINPDLYYNSLERYFRYLESKYSTKVIIAAHPRSQYENYPQYFRGFEIIKGKTPELVKNSAVVLAHTSTSISFAMLWRKPTVFLTSNELNSSLKSNQYKVLKEKYGGVVTNIDDPNFDINIYQCQPDFDKYVNDFIKKSGIELQNSMDGILNFLKKS